MREIADLAHRLVVLAPDEPLRGVVADVAVAIRTAGGDAEPLARLVDAFALSPFERDLLVLLGLPEEHELLSHVARSAHPDGEPWLTVGALATVLGLDAFGRGHLRRALEEGPLRASGLIDVAPGRPYPERSLRLATGLWTALRGCSRWPDEVPLTPVVAAAPNGLEGLAAALATGRRVVVVVTGPASRPKVELASAVAGALASRDTRAVFVDAALLDDDRSRLVSAHAIARGCVPVLVGRPPVAPLAGHPGPVVLCVPEAEGLTLDERPAVTFDLGDRTLAESVAMWDNLLPPLDGAARSLAGLLRIDPVRAREAVADAVEAASLDGGRLDVEAVVAQARRRTDRTLPSTVRLVRPSSSWADVVTSDDNAALLRSVVDRIHGQVQVLHDWGLGRRGGRGARVLLAGPPGTGKTLSAGIVAAALGLDLLLVDLSALVSKWLGETEKNIAEVFDAAERSQAVLFFDEADAVFGRRTDAGDAQARWANLETAYLLGRIDAFDGLVVLATNLRANIDEAFVRRLDVVVEFDEPSADERRRLWRLHLPSTAPTEPGVDIDELSLYPISGGLIRNAALAAGFAAAADRRPISQHHLLVAVEREYQKAGRTFPGRPRVLAGA